MTACLISERPCYPIDCCWKRVVDAQPDLLIVVAGSQPKPPCKEVLLSGASSKQAKGAHRASRLRSTMCYLQYRSSQKNFLLFGRLFTDFKRHDPLSPRLDFRQLTTSVPLPLITRGYES
ncbi:hypothetical protein ACFE04_019142 [Oxalis oulophora]